MLMSIPIISPIDFAPHPASVRLLPGPEDANVEASTVDDGSMGDADYTVHDEPPDELVMPEHAYLVASPALMALNQIEQAAERGDHHPWWWWTMRTQSIRAALKRSETTIRYDLKSQREAEANRYAHTTRVEIDNAADTEIANHPADQLVDQLVDEPITDTPYAETEAAGPEAATHSDETDAGGHT